MFDLLMLLTFALGFVRSWRVGFVVGALTTGVMFGAVVLGGWGALHSPALQGKGYVSTAIGVMFAGPSAVPHDDPIPVLGQPTVVALVSALLSGGCALHAGRMAQLEPQGERAERWGRVQLAFVGAFSFVALRVITGLLFDALAADP